MGAGPEGAPSFSWLLRLSPGFYDYREPIRWIVHLSERGAYLEAAELAEARPFSGRTSGREEHLLADEAAYALGASRKDDGGQDRHAADKHKRFLNLCQRFVGSPTLRDPELRHAVANLIAGLEQEWPAQDDRFESVGNKDWVSFMPEQGSLAGTHLFMHPNARAFWFEEMRNRCTREEGRASTVIVGGCAVCGREGVGLVRKLPLGVKLAGTTPLHSLNASAFTSFIGGPGTSDRAHLGLCYECGDTAARAFNYLSNDQRHRRQLVRDRRKRDSLSNQYALFWLRAPAPLQVGESVLDPSDLESLDLAAVVSGITGAPEPDLAQMHALLKLPWSPVEAALRLDDYGFYLGVLSPNVGRIAVREWIAVSLGPLKESLAAFIESTRMVQADGQEQTSATVRTMVSALASANPNLSRMLLRTAYTGVRPPLALVIQAGRRLNELMANEGSLRERQRARRGDQARVWDEEWPHALAAAVKLGLFYGQAEGSTMTEANALHGSRAYHCGRLLAVLEEAQQWHYYRRNHERLKTTMVGRAYGGAASTPASTFGRLWRVASIAHLPEAGGRINKEVEAISSTLVELGGMPEHLTAAEQAEFGLGFYHQRARNRTIFRNEEAEEGAPKEDGSAGEQETT